ncbi:MAG: hypothetical protein JXA73_18025 [Acidobacteria bacterium]|nr:hypothetical protein [Acidobacteriota bacterium]
MIRSKSMALFLIFFAALPGLAQTRRNEKADRPLTAPIHLEASNPSMILSRVELEFSSESKEARTSGAVRVEMLVNEKGEVYEAKVLDGHPFVSFVVLVPL